MLKHLALALVLLAPISAEVLETAPTDPVARGKYLANGVAMCVQCHSPHDRQGDLLESQLFTGQAMPFEAPFPDGPNWASRAPALKRLPGWTNDDLVHLLTTGRRVTGRKPASPMPQFRMSRADAEAIALYLRSL